MSNCWPRSGLRASGNFDWRAARLFTPVTRKGVTKTSSLDLPRAAEPSAITIVRASGAGSGFTAAHHRPSACPAAGRRSRSNPSTAPGGAASAGAPTRNCCCQGIPNFLCFLPVLPMPFTFLGIRYSCAHRNTRWVSLTWTQTCSMGVRMSLPYCTRASVQPYPVGCTVPRRSGTKPEPGSPNKSGYSEGGLTVDHTTPYRRDEQVFACSSRCFQRCAKHHFPFEKRSKAPTKRKNFLKGLRPSGSDLGPISGRTPPSVQTPRRRPKLRPPGVDLYG